MHAHSTLKILNLGRTRRIQIQKYHAGRTVHCEIHPGEYLLRLLAGALAEEAVLAGEYSRYVLSKLDFHFMPAFSLSFPSCVRRTSDAEVFKIAAHVNIYIRNNG